MPHLMFLYHRYSLDINLKVTGNKPEQVLVLSLFTGFRGILSASQSVLAPQQQ